MSSWGRYNPSSIFYSFKTHETILVTYDNTKNTFDYRIPLFNENNMTKNTNNCNWTKSNHIPCMIEPNLR